MGFRSLVEHNLFEFIQRMNSKHKQNISDTIKNYGKSGVSNFDTDFGQAVDSLMELSKYEFTDIYENMRDIYPLKRGVLLCERELSHETYDLSLMDSRERQDVFYESFVSDWAEETLQNSSYTDLLSYFVRFGEKTVDPHGYLTGLEFNTRSFTYLLITNEYEFLPIRIDEIYLAFSSGAELSLCELPTT